jgi:hypothetical protein
MKQAILIWVICVFAFEIKAQTVVYGQVTDTNGGPIAEAHIKWQGKLLAKTNDLGEYEFIHPKKSGNILLEVSHVSYKPTQRWVRLNKKDTVNATFKLFKQVYELPEFTAFDKRLPEQVFHTNLHYVHDFEIENDRLVLITFSQNLRKDPRLTLCTTNEVILDEIPLSSKPQALFRDFAGRLFVEYEYKVELIVIDNDKIGVTEVDAREYHLNVKPCKDSVHSTILFSDQLWFLPRFNYMAFDVSDSLVFLLKEVVHKQVNHMMRWTYYDMKIDDQRRARKIADHFPELDKQEVAGLMSGFHNSIFYEEPYVPLFVKNDTILIFDHYSDFIFRYSKALETIDSLPIEYHKPQKKWTWKDKVYYDEKQQLFYGLFLQNGYAYLKELDLKSGTIKEENKLQNQFVKKIKVHDGYAYYLHKPFSSPDKPFIYRELLSVK